MLCSSHFATSFVTRHSSFVTLHSSLVTRHSSLVTRPWSLPVRAALAGTTCAVTTVSDHGHVGQSRRAAADPCPAVRPGPGHGQGSWTRTRHVTRLVRNHPAQPAGDLSEPSRFYKSEHTPEKACWKGPARPGPARDRAGSGIHRPPLRLRRSPARRPCGPAQGCGCQPRFGPRGTDKRAARMAGGHGRQLQAAAAAAAAASRR